MLDIRTSLTLSFNDLVLFAACRWRQPVEDTILAAGVSVVFDNADDEKDQLAAQSLYFEARCETVVPPTSNKFREDHLKARKSQNSVRRKVKLSDNTAMLGQG